MEIKWIANAFAIIFGSLVIGETYVRSECYKANIEIVKKGKDPLSC